MVPEEQVHSSTHVARGHTEAEKVAALSKFAQGAPKDSTQILDTHRLCTFSQCHPVPVLDISVRNIWAMWTKDPATSEGVNWDAFSFSELWFGGRPVAMGTGQLGG